ncbi:LuxR C-terminal-related transcriptional regulator [Gordonia rubripertincta]|uniref:LuxR family transcriptional regulator n=1 Tax=Gordonia rubripertincta TaxID=36822 RepID=A0AAW4G1C4_GORRU|nr:LuxR C-terminal-related transcriptional regulator [Gordonia rubripertincta]MBM7277044.1 LuxR family transcriptional regulator [Gordonia rubripertincta]QMU20936.1 LuxR family transcriptional regulator [Gordonia rubripertincta]
MTATSEFYRTAQSRGAVDQRRVGSPEMMLHNGITRLADYRPVGDLAPAAPRPSLSDREVEVLLAWLAAESKEEAAARLFISASTVSTHLARIRAKYTAVGRPAPTKTHLFARALQDGYTSLDRW